MTPNGGPTAPVPGFAPAPVPAEGGLPPPLPSPDELEEPADGGQARPPPFPDDPLEFLYEHRINFAAGGVPLVTIRLTEGQTEIRLTSGSPLTVALRGAGPKSVRVPARATLSLRLGRSKPAEVRHFVQVGDLLWRDHEAVSAARALWRSRGFQVSTRVLGTVFGITGRVLDNRHTVVLLGEGDDAAAAERLIREVGRRFGVTATDYQELSRRPRGVVEIADGTGAVVAASLDLAIVSADGGATILVNQVEFGKGYPFHGRQDRRYRGRLYVTIGADGRLALVEAVPLEDLLRGLVPKEIYAAAPPAALEAQAVTARGEVLAKIGMRHLIDPYLLCAEQHCQVYGGAGGEQPSTDAAVAATRGEALFSKDGVLVDSVYSAVCGGQTENNETVWGTPPDPSLRGVSDLVEGAAPDLRREAALRRWVESDPPGYCGLASFAGPGKYRWTRRLGAAEIDRLLAPLGVGRILALRPYARGVSGRATALAVRGDHGATEIRGELSIRRWLGGLNSSAFVVDVELGPGGKPAVFVFHGAGWGHGVGMCQTGAIGRARRGQSYRQILRHYFGGAEIVRIYGSGPSSGGR